MLNKSYSTSNSTIGDELGLILLAATFTNSDTSKNVITTIIIIIISFLDSVPMGVDCMLHHKAPLGSVFCLFAQWFTLKRKTKSGVNSGVIFHSSERADVQMTDHKNYSLHVLAKV